MHQLTSTTVVEELVAELASRRRRQAGYLALARAIVADAPACPDAAGPSAVPLPPAQLDGYWAKYALMPSA